MTKFDELMLLLNKYGLGAKKHLGQNFLVDEKVLDEIVESADLNETDNVIEVGPGTGFLTERLVENVKSVTAVEYDNDMISVLNGRFNGVDNLNIIHSDILQFKINDLKFKNSDYKVVANIPYYITSPLLRHFLQAEVQPSLIVLLVQKEVAEKICGITGKSLITIETQLFGKPEIIDIVPAKSFYPEPKVDSAILKIDIFKKPLVDSDHLNSFLRIVKFGFTQKRKKLGNSLASGLHIKPPEMRDILSGAGIDANLRAEDLDIEDWKTLTKILNPVK